MVHKSIMYSKTFSTTQPTKERRGGGELKPTNKNTQKNVGLVAYTVCNNYRLYRLNSVCL